MPTRQQMETSRLDLIVAGSHDSVLMIEGFGHQLPEDQMADAIMFAQRAITELCQLRRVRPEARQSQSRIASTSRQAIRCHSA